MGKAGIDGKKMRKSRNTITAAIGIFAILLAVCISVLILYQKISAPKYHYELSEELRLTFTNADYVIEQIREGLEDHSQRIILDFTTENDHMGDISALVHELMECALSETDSPRQGDYLRYQYGGYELEYGYEERDGIYRYHLTITPNYYTTLKQEETVDIKVAEILAGMRFHWYTSEAEKVHRIYEYVYDTVEYDMVHRNNRQYHLKTTAYAALVNKRAVCQGYSVLMYRLLREAGVNARVITGTLKEGDGTEYHAWNLVEIDGAWYNLDVTWDRMLESDAYYLKTDQSMADHVRDEGFAAETFYSQYPMAEKDYVQNKNE